MVPALLVVAPEAVPTAPLVVVLPMVLVLALAEREGLDRVGFARLTAGRIPGTVVGAWVLSVPTTRLLGGAIGLLLLAVVGASLLRGRRADSPGLEVAADFASGVAGILGAVGGPYMGLPFANRPGPCCGGTVSAAFVVGTVLSLAAIALAGMLDGAAARLGLALVPATFIGILAGRRSPTGSTAAPAPHRVACAGAAGLFALERAILDKLIFSRSSEKFSQPRETGRGARLGARALPAGDCAGRRDRRGLGDAPDRRPCPAHPGRRCRRAPDRRDARP